MRELWRTVAELLTPPSDLGDTRYFSNVVAWAIDESDLQQTITMVAVKYSWHLINIDNSFPVERMTDFSDELLEQIEAAKPLPEACVFGTLHYYPSRPV
jgi:hypothetical protein